MNKEAAAKKKAEWLAGCLEFGWSKEDLDDLSNVWDQFKDEYGHPRPKTESTTPIRGGQNKEVDPEIINASMALARTGWQMACDELLSWCSDKKVSEQFTNQIVEMMDREKKRQFNWDKLKEELAKVENAPFALVAPSPLPASIQEQAEKYARDKMPCSETDLLSFLKEAIQRDLRDAYLAGAATRAENAAPENDYKLPGHDDVVESLDKLTINPAAKSPWISTDKDTPLEATSVLCFRRNENGMIEDSWEEFTDQNKDWFIQTYSHWMPLPQSPKSKGG